jgi:hypothetical protein
MLHKDVDQPVTLRIQISLVSYEINSLYVKQECPVLQPVRPLDKNLNFGPLRDAFTLPSLLWLCLQHCRYNRYRMI